MAGCSFPPLISSTVARIHFFQRRSATELRLKLKNDIKDVLVSQDYILHGSNGATATSKYLPDDASKALPHGEKHHWFWDLRHTSLL